MTTRQFHIGDILTITTGRLVATRHMDAVYDLLNFMTGDELFTHQLPRVSRECEPELLRQHPDLADVEVPDSFDDDSLGVDRGVAAWLAEQVARFGEYRDVTPMPTQDHTRINPIVELAMNHPHIEVVPVVDMRGGDS